MKKALILGVTGNFGRAQAQALLDDGWQLNLLLRIPEKFNQDRTVDHTNVTIFKGDAANIEDLLLAGADCQVIVNGINLPYDQWLDKMPALNENVMNVAKTLSATILFPGNIYNFAAKDGPLYDEQSPQNPTTKKGIFRKQLEQDMAHFAQTQGVQIIILRAGDYWGPNSSDSSMFKYLVLNNVAKGKIMLAGARDKKHAWSYLPDLGRIGVALMNRRQELSLFEVFHSAGHELTGAEMVEAVETSLGKKLKVGKFPWAMIKLMGYFKKTFAEMLELKFMADVDQRLSQVKLVELLGEVPKTEIQEALKITFLAHDINIKH